jgi:AcrR family transcriptional regulator
MANRKTLRKPAAKEQSSTPETRPKRNLPADERRRLLLDAAMDLFSERGLGITVQALADRVHVTQPLVHRYFPAKADLIAAIRDRIHNAHWDPIWRQILTNRCRPLEERLRDFYGRYLPHIYRSSWYRGFWYAALADPTFAQVYLDHVTRELLTSIIDEVRARFGYPSVAVVPVFAREIELVWGMHSTMVFVGIRRYVYKIRVSDDVDTTVNDQMRAYLLVAPSVMAELMPASAKSKVQARVAKTPRGGRLRSALSTEPSRPHRPERHTRP